LISILEIEKTGLRKLFRIT